MQRELAFDSAGLGAAVAMLFAAAAAGSGPAGAIAERIGPRRSIRSGTGAAAVVMLVRTWPHLLVAMALAGLATSLVQPSVNALMMRGTVAARRGLAFGIKQSGVPGAALVGGAAVPLVALTFGWRAAYACGAVVALCAAVAVPAPASRSSRPPADRCVLSRWLVIVAVATGLGSATASVLGVFVVTSGVESGIGLGTAGWLLSAGSLTVIVVRIVVGWVADRRGGRFGLVAAMLSVGSVGSRSWRLAAARRSSRGCSSPSGWAGVGTGC